MARKTKVSVSSASTVMSSVDKKADLLSTLPARVTADIFSSWLVTKAIARLDSAYCSKLSRPSLLTVFNCNQFVMKDVVDAAEDTWILRKEIKVSSLSFTKSFDIHLLSTYLRRWGSHIRSVKVHPNKLADEIYLLALFCKNITHVCYEADTITYAFRDMMLNNPNIRYLSISGFRTYDTNLFNDLSPHKLECLAVNAQCAFSWATSAYSNSLRQVHFNTGIGEWSLRTLLKNCPQVTHLRLADVEEGQLEVVASLRPNVEHLDISYSDVVTDECLLEIIRRLHNLRSLNISDCSDISETCLSDLADHCGNTLEVLYVNLSTPLHSSTVKMFAQFAKKCIVLKKLHICSDRRANLCNEGGTFALMQGLPQLHKLVLQYESLISLTSRQFIGVMRPDLQIIVDEKPIDTFSALNC